MSDPTAATAPGAAEGRSLALGNLRTALTLLVVAHHAFLAYHPYAPPPPADLAEPPMLWPAFPVVDAVKWPGIDLFTGWNDIYFMALMFLLAGVFLPASLARRGPAAYLGQRGWRLGLPFLGSALLLAPLAYYPSYLATAPADRGAGAFLAKWLALPGHPAGPAWFLWVLLAFGATAALLQALAPGWLDALGRASAALEKKPALYLLALTALSAAVYLPAAAYFSPLAWLDWGPFWVQIARLPLYALYFFAGAGLGARRLASPGLLAPDSPLPGRWLRYAIGAALSFAFAVATFLLLLAGLEKGAPSAFVAHLCNFGFVLCCACSSLAMIACFLRFGTSRRPALVALGAAAYGIYLFHYVFTSWLQHLLLGAALPASAKGLLVFIGAVLLAWALTAALRRLPPLRRVL